MTEKDIPQVAEIEKQAFTLPWSEHSFQNELKYKERTVYLVVAGAAAPDYVLGYCGYWKIIDEAHITNIAVRNGFRGRHLGRRLMEKIIDSAISHGMLHITLEVRVSNFVALALYESLGFTCVGSRKGYYSDTGEDALIMWLYTDRR
ncbi:MAG: ribosomal protein S18-alanine N-acetyltransferase [Peptococcaceae bacterium]|jgi:ribosomal-protein-alanine N-acetyltransferase|nr:ribosomal protein S18-alanine N-acetyltransferase [Peptococcaceae bacterium]